MHSSVAVVKPASDTNKQTASLRTFRLVSFIFDKTYFRFSLFKNNFVAF